MYTTWKDVTKLTIYSQILYTKVWTALLTGTKKQICVTFLEAIYEEKTKLF